MQVMEEYDSEECSIDSEEEELGSEGDCYEADFVVPDNVVIYASGKIIRDDDDEQGPFGKPSKNQPDSIIETQDGQIITISWHVHKEDISSDEDYIQEMSNEDDDDDDEDYVQEMSIEDDEKQIPSNEERIVRPRRQTVLYQPPLPETKKSKTENKKKK
jgi:hypothetical protein